MSAPKCGENEIVIKTTYSSLNYKGALSSVGNPGVTRKFPHVTGIDITNEISLEDVKETYALMLEGKSVGRYVVKI